MTGRRPPFRTLVQLSSKSAYTLVVFDAGVMCSSLRAETEAEDVSVVGAVSDEERAVWKVRQPHRRFLPAQRAPVPFTLHTGSIVLSDTRISSAMAEGPRDALVSID